MPDNPLVITDSDIAGVVKRIYESYREKAFPLSTPLLAQLKKAKPGGPEKMQWGGDGLYFDVVLTRPTGMTGSGSGFFPPTSKAREQQSTLGIKRTYVTRQLDHLAILGTESKESAFISLARKVYEEAIDAARLGQQEVLHGNGLGVKAIVDTVSSTTSIICSGPYGVAGAGAGGLLLDKDMYIAVLATGGATERGKSYISAVSNSGDNCTVTLTSAIVGMQATDVIVAATTSDNAYNQMPQGLMSITNRAAGFNNFQGINNATAGNERWNTTRLTPADADTPNEMDVWDLATRIAGRSGKDAKLKSSEFLMMSTPGIEKKLAESFLGQRRWDAEVNPTLKGGFKAVQICGINMISDYWCPAGTLYMVHVPSLTWVDRMDWTKVRYEDSGAWRFIPGRDAFEFTLASYWNTGCILRNSHGMYTGYTDATRYSHEM